MLVASIELKFQQYFDAQCILYISMPAYRSIIVICEHLLVIWIFYPQENNIRINNYWLFSYNRFNQNTNGLVEKDMLHS